ncbi:unnamed protein product [Lactuca virosa]|uniref:Uncharacterized protein n=1 Tax=Lactuca virosa TaxID=75947 RepID=A0AAU9MRY6_9ASTR|nr:unnamed protein product [Lactuca virosa]
MRSVHHYHHPPPLSTTLNHQPAPSGLGGVLVFQRHNFYLPVVNPTRIKAMAITTSRLVVLGVNSPATTGDLTVLIPTSLAFLFLYWIANFVVPGMVMRDLESDDANKDENSNEEGFK